MPAPGLRRNARAAARACLGLGCGLGLSGSLRAGGGSAAARRQCSNSPTKLAQQNARRGNPLRHAPSAWQPLRPSPRQPSSRERPWRPWAPPSSPESWPFLRAARRVSSARERPPRCSARSPPCKEDRKLANVSWSVESLPRNRQRHGSYDTSAAPRDATPGSARHREAAPAMFKKCAPVSALRTALRRETGCARRRRRAHPLR